jgi:hypothetical protein
LLGAQNEIRVAVLVWVDPEGARCDVALVTNAEMRGAPDVLQVLMPWIADERAAREHLGHLLKSGLESARSQKLSIYGRSHSLSVRSGLDI